jgi:hypothetical protein
MGIFRCNFGFRMFDFGIKSVLSFNYNGHTKKKQRAIHFKLNARNTNK